MKRLRDRNLRVPWDGLEQLLQVSKRKVQRLRFAAETKAAAVLAAL